MELIDKQVAIDALANAIPSLTTPDGCGEFDHDRQIAAETFVDAMQIIHDLLAVEAEPVRQTAEWIYGEKDGADGWYCSKCGFHIPWYYEYYGLNNINFIKDFHTCPHCDAKMMKYTGMEGEQA